MGHRRITDQLQPPMALAQVAQPQLLHRCMEVPCQEELRVPALCRLHYFAGAMAHLYVTLTVREIFWHPQPYGEGLGQVEASKELDGIGNIQKCRHHQHLEPIADSSRQLVTNLR